MVEMKKSFLIAFSNIYYKQEMLISKNLKCVTMRLIDKETKKYYAMFIIRMKKDPPIPTNVKLFKRQHQRGVSHDTS